IETRQHILHFLTVGTEGVSNEVQRRETHTQEIDLRSLPEMQLVGDCRGELSEILIRQRRSHPVAEELRVWFSGFRSQHVWKRSRPSRWRAFRRVIVFSLIGGGIVQTFPRMFV